jgi:biotin carboxylase
MGHLIFVETSKPGVEALRISKQLGHRVTFVTDHRFDGLLSKADLDEIRAMDLDLVDVENSQDAEVLTRAIAQAGGEDGVDAMLTTMHPCVVAVARAASRLGVRATSVAGIINAHDKGRCRSLLAEHRLPTVRHAVVDSVEAGLAAAASIGFPLIVKPTKGSGKVLTAIVEGNEELRRHLEAARALIGPLRSLREEVDYEFVLEEVAQGRMYSAELAVRGGICTPLVVIRRKRARHNPILEVGSSIPGGLDLEQLTAVGRYMQAVTRVLGLDLGLFHAEFIWTSYGPCLVEINPRMAGGGIPGSIKAATGGNLAEVLVKLFTLTEFDLSPFEVRSCISHTFIGALDDAALREDLSPGWFEAFRPRLYDGDVSILPGQKLVSMRENADAYGFVRMRAKSVEEAERLTEELRRDIEVELGASLVVPE